MATAVFKTPPYLCSTAGGGSTLKARSLSRVCFVSGRLPVIRCRISSDRTSVKLPSRSVLEFLTFAADGEIAETEVETIVKDRVEGSESEIEIEWITDGAVSVDDSDKNDDTDVEECSSAAMAQLNLYKEALENKDVAKIAEVESFLKTLEDEKKDLQKTVVALSEELSSEKDRVLRISVGFDNFRKRTERERLSLVSNAQEEVIKSLLPVLDSFEQAKAQIKVETEGEEKINNSYLSINKQFVEILASLGVGPVETAGKPVDPMVSFRVGSVFSRVIDDLLQKLYKVGSQVKKMWIRI